MLYLSLLLKIARLNVVTIKRDERSNENEISLFINLLDKHNQIIYV